MASEKSCQLFKPASFLGLFPSLFSSCAALRKPSDPALLSSSDIAAFDTGADSLEPPYLALAGPAPSQGPKNVGPDAYRPKRSARDALADQARRSQPMGTCFGARASRLCMRKPTMQERAPRDAIRTCSAVF